MPSSLPERAATAELWRRRPRGAPPLAAAAALTGIDLGRLADATAIALAASPEAAELLDGMELRVRTLTTTVATSTERCVHEVRGPIRWSETMTARANAFGNEDVFVCSTAARSFDTAENRALVAALEALARAARALGGPVGELVDELTTRRVAAVAAEAASWRDHPRLAGVRPGRHDARERARLRSGHRLHRLAPVLAVARRAGEPLEPDDVAGLCDPATRRLHVEVLAAFESEGPDGWSYGDGRWRSGRARFRHPALPDGGPVGLQLGDR